MALIKCKECGKEISTTAENCPHCGWRTQHGRSITNTKFQLVLFIIVVAILVAGLVILFKNLGDFLDLVSDWSRERETSYWERRTFAEYVDVRDETEVTQNMLVAAIMVVGGFISLVKLKNKAEFDQEVQGNGFILEKEEEKRKAEYAERQRQQRQHAYAAKVQQAAEEKRTAPPPPPPDLPLTAKIVYCPMCGKSQFAYAKRCFSCGTELAMPEKKEEKTIFCHMCGLKQSYNNTNCEVCGTELLKD